MSDWKLEYWQAGGIPELDLLVGTRFLFEPNMKSVEVKVRVQEGERISAVQGEIVAHKTEARSDAHTDYVRLTLVVRADAGAAFTDAEISFDAYSLDWISDHAKRGRMEWNLYEGLEDPESFRDHLPGELTILDS